MAVDARDQIAFEDRDAHRFAIVFARSSGDGSMRESDRFDAWTTGDRVARIFERSSAVDTLGLSTNCDCTRYTPRIPPELPSYTLVGIAHRNQRSSTLRMH